MYIYVSTQFLLKLSFDEIRSFRYENKTNERHIYI